MATVKPKRIKHTVESNRKYQDALEHVARLFPYPQPGGATRLHFQTDEKEPENTHRSLTGFYDWDAVEKANRLSERGK